MANQRTKEMMEQITGLVTADASDFIETMKEVIEDQDVKKVPENVFREIFLPFFTGETQGTKENDYVAHWAGIVGSPTSPADVVDMKGDTLFRVPPLFDTRNLNVSGRQNKYGSMLVEMVDQAMVHPGIAYPEFVEKSSAALDNLLGKEELPNYKEWRKIYEFYGLTKSAEAIEKETKPDAEDFFE